MFLAHASARGDDALDRKSARMQRDYEVAVMMTAALRSTLAHMKLHRLLDEVYSPFHTDASHPACRARISPRTRATTIRRPGDSPQLSGTLPDRRRHG